MRCAVLSVSLGLAMVLGGGACGGELADPLARLRAVGPNGEGHAEATAAWASVARAEAAALPEVLAALDGANPLAANWIRTAVDAIAERELALGRLPARTLELFACDRVRAPRARRLAYEWLLRVDPTAEERLIPGMLDDPSLEFRRDAVARLMDQAEAGDKTQALAANRRALAAARDVDQIRALAQRLRKLGAPVDIVRQMGFVVQWHLIGPFDNTDGKGFDTAYGPEREIRLEATYAGKHKPVGWVEQRTTDEWGIVDLNKALGEEKWVAGYAATEFQAAEGRAVELRLTSHNATKLWLNGRLVDQHEVYHAGSRLDQYVCRVELSPGRNVILLKVCQNAIEQDWARNWRFQLRVCDAQGKAVPGRP